MGGMCARVCPTETLCEEVCVREIAEGKPVKIGELQRYATDHLMETTDAHPFERAERTGKRVAVVGAGPAGMSCAHRLAMHGHDVTVFEAREKAGGLNEFGIAEYKAMGEFAQAEIEFILGIGGIKIENSKALGTDIELAALAEEYDAVFLGMGLPDTNDLGLTAEDADNCLDAVRYIERIRQTDDLSSLPLGKNIVVIGGGMTGIDVAAQTKLMGADTVTICYRREPDQMVASEYERDLAQTHGVVIRHWMKPSALETDMDGNVTGIMLARTALDGGKLVDTGETVTLPADQIFKAIGQVPKPEMLGDMILDLERGRIAVGEDRKSRYAKIWAGGDCIHPSLKS